MAAVSVRTRSGYVSGPARPPDRRVEGPTIGSPETVARKIANTSRLLGLARFNMKYSNGTLPHDKLLRSIELFGTRVAPRVRELVQQDVVEGSSANR